MDAIRVPKVSDVLCSKAGRTSVGTLHLTAHHIIFTFNDNAEPEMWVPYPLIALVTRLPYTLSGQAPISFRCRTFETFSLFFSKDSDAGDVFDSVKELTVAPSITSLYAFFYTPNPPLTENNGWNLYVPREEFGRMGVGTRTKAWRFTDINKDYSFSPTYPARMVVPTRISDTTLQYAVKYRSKGRIPALTYLHWANYGSITRSSQPMVGLTNARSVQDEKLIEAVFQSHYSPDSRAGASSPVYGNTTTNLIIDARPTTNAMANTAKGAGTENMDHYKDCKKAYLGIDNIHTMRDSLNKVVEALRETELLAASLSGGDPGVNTPVVPVDRSALRRSGWLRHISAIMEGVLIIVRNVHVSNSHVLIHCSDGWDRTSQLSAVAQLCLDPFYRTIRGFQILVEKDWLSFGHRFLDRCGHLSSEKFFLTPVEGTGGGEGGGAGAAQAFFASVQNRFASNHHVKETSPVFHQFLETVRNIQRQFPDRFEFNERFLHDLHYHLYSCQFGSFLFNSEKERRLAQDKTISVWDWMNSTPRRDEYLNPTYDSSLDDPMSRAQGADQGVLLPNPKDLRFWNELYGRSDEEMNGKYVQAQAQGAELVGPVENAEDDPAMPSSAVSGDDLDTTPSTPITLTPTLSTPPLPNAPPEPGAATLTLTSSAMQRRASNSSLRLSAPTAVPTQRASSPLPRTSNSPQPYASLRSSSTSSPTSRSRPLPPKPQSDFLSTTSGGLRSMWGKLSSNAGAALSAAQIAYDGVAKDFASSGLRGAYANNDDASSSLTPGGELRGRDELSAWGSTSDHESTWSPTSGGGGGGGGGGGQKLAAAVRPSTFAASSSTLNPWASVRERPNAPNPSMSTLFENPWNTASEGRTSGAAAVGGVAGSNSGQGHRDTRDVFGNVNGPDPVSPASLAPMLRSSSGAGMPLSEPETWNRAPGSSSTDINYISGDSGLPLDPTVAQPIPRTASSSSRSGIVGQSVAGVSTPSLMRAVSKGAGNLRQSSTPALTPPEPPAKDGQATDPLGVGIV